MSDRHPVARLAEKRARPVITNAPALPAIAFGKIGQSAPGLPSTPDSLPAADAAVAWGSFVYDAYGFYTSYNGALAAWAILAAAKP